MVNLETWKIWNEAVLGAVIDGRMQTVTSLTEVLFDICKMEEAHQGAKAVQESAATVAAKVEM
ncbi:hypothetical protein TSUD_235020 [Trifolium subterraneum]|uniref:Uncharacterized protein n=1 Tax=Trifolium subterraneum TaxID=3900 RepID=A0A2Z6MH58_TRISU|nr:hypothetical protein TSUD_235020 [Trifolium subterraneum]